MRKWLVAVLPVALIVACGSSSSGTFISPPVPSTETPTMDVPSFDAPTEDPAITPPPSTFTAGQPADLNITTTNRLDGTTTDSNVTITVGSVSTPNVSADGLGDTPKNGLFIVANVHFQVTSGSLDYNLFDFQLQLPDGTVYQPGNGNAIAAGIDPTLDSGNLSAGQQVAGYIVFDANAPHGTINYKPSDSVIASWNY